jgi:hypothetical protein
MDGVQLDSRMINSATTGNKAGSLVQIDGGVESSRVCRKVSEWLGVFALSLQATTG